MARHGETPVRSSKLLLAVCLPLPRRNDPAPRAASYRRRARMLLPGLEFAPGSRSCSRAARSCLRWFCGWQRRRWRDARRRAFLVARRLSPRRLGLHRNARRDRHLGRIRSGERAFSTTIPFLGKGANELIGRSAFGAGALLTWLFFFVAATTWWRKLSGSKTPLRPRALPDYVDQCIGPTVAGKRCPTRIKSGAGFFREML